MKFQTIAVFKWEDAAGLNRWNERDDNPTTMFATVVGILIEDSQEVITVGLERFEDGSWRDTLTVPKRLLVAEPQYFKIPKRLL